MIDVLTGSWWALLSDGAVRRPGSAAELLGSRIGEAGRLGGVGEGARDLAHLLLPAPALPLRCVSAAAYRAARPGGERAQSATSASTSRSRAARRTLTSSAAVIVVQAA